MFVITIIINLKKSTGSIIKFQKEQFETSCDLHNVVVTWGGGRPALGSNQSQSQIAFILKKHLEAQESFRTKVRWP